MAKSIRQNFLTWAVALLRLFSPRAARGWTRSTRQADDLKLR
jgi:hypothetical protein